MAQMNVSNTLWNDTSSGEIAYAEQLKDKTTSYAPYEKLTPSIISQYHLDTKLQDRLNNFFLHHYNEWREFIEDEGLDPEKIDSWYEVQRFLEDISDSEAMTLNHIITELEMKSGTLNISMDDEVPGMMIATSTSTVMDITDSFIDDETGIIKIVYSFE